jgi:hypothetical protein
MTQDASQPRQVTYKSAEGFFVAPLNVFAGSDESNITSAALQQRMSPFFPTQEGAEAFMMAQSAKVITVTLCCACKNAVHDCTCDPDDWDTEPPTIKRRMASPGRLYRCPECNAELGHVPTNWYGTPTCKSDAHPGATYLCNLELESS